MKNKCTNCNERKMGCHAICESYKKWKEEQEEHKKLIRKSRDEEGIMYRSERWSKHIIQKTRERKRR